MNLLPTNIVKRLGEIVGSWRGEVGGAARGLLGDVEGVLAVVNGPSAELVSALARVVGPAKVEEWSYVAPADGRAGHLPEGARRPAGVILFASKQRVETLGLVAVMQAQLAPLAPGGRLLFCCENALGAKGFQSRFQEAFASVEVHLAQSWRLMALGGVTAEGAAVLAEWWREASEQVIPGTSFHTVPGIYGWNKVDAGSQLLIEALPGPLVGRGLDLGCGYGYLSHEALSRSPEITGLTLLDHDWRALECARRNLAGFAIPKEFVWADVSQFRPRPEADWALVNPPFHSGKQVDMALGRAFVAAAAAGLQTRGTLHLVGNSFLPYGETLRRLFARVEKVREGGGFVVWRGEFKI